MFGSDFLQVVRSKVETSAVKTLGKRRFKSQVNKVKRTGLLIFFAGDFARWLTCLRICASRGYFSEWLKHMS